MAVAQLRGVVFVMSRSNLGGVYPGYFPSERDGNMAGAGSVAAWNALDDVAHWIGLNKDEYNDMCQASPERVLTMIREAV